MGTLRAAALWGATLLAWPLAGCGSRSSLDAGAPARTEGPELAVPRFDCRVADGTRPMLASRLGGSVYFSYPDRTSHEVFTFALPEGSYVTGADVVARGDRVAAYIIADALGAATEPPPFAEVVVLHVDGTVLFHERYDFAYEGWGSDSRLTGNAAGLFVLTLLEVQTGLGLVIDGTEAHTFAEPMAGRSDPDAEGQMVVWDSEASSTADLHFFDVPAGTFTPSQYISEDPFDDLASSPTVLGSGLLYLERNPPRLVYEGASGTSELPVDVDFDYPGHASPGYSASGGYRLFMLGGTTELDARYLVTHFASGEVREFRLDPPAGYQIPGDYWNPPPIDARGRLLVPFTGVDTVQLHATADGATWEPVGRPIAESGYATSTREVGGTVIFDGWGGGLDVPGALPSHAAQLVGPQGGDGIELVRNDEPGAPDNPLYADDTISDDGACLAYFRNGNLHVVEVADYTSSDLGLLGGILSAEMAWIPLAE